MIEIITAKTAGFCFGVQRAVDIVEEQAEKNKGPVYTWGPIVHNEDVINDLSQRGVRVIHSYEELDEIEKGTIIIRAHGVTPETERIFREKGFCVIDATCPFVKKIHRIVKEHSDQGETVIVAGDPEHPEVKGILGYCKGPHFCVENEQDLSIILRNNHQKLCIVAQTTFNYKKFEKIVEIVKELSYNATIANTICSATRDRQEEAAAIAESVNLMIVVGSPDSSNSGKLYEICKNKCNQTHFIQRAEDLKKEWFYGEEYVGITAGASTPKKIFEEVQTNVRKF